MSIAARALAVVAIAAAAACSDGGGAAIDAGPGDGDGGIDASTTAPIGTHVFDPDVLHVIELTVAAEHLAQLDDNQNQDRVPATISFDGETITNAGLRKKGATSLRPLSEKSGQRRLPRRAVRRRQRQPLRGPMGLPPRRRSRRSQGRGVREPDA